MSDADIVERLEDAEAVARENELTVMACILHDGRTVITSLRTELAAMRERVEWQPIETAPKGELQILLLGCVVADGMVCSSGYWTSHNGGGWVRWMPREPTHWMPLPPIPTDTKETGE